MKGYRVKRSGPPPPYVVASLFRVKHGARVMERKSLNSQLLDRLAPGALFHGLIDGPWVRRVGGGYVVRLSVEEIV